jgi:tryptophan-rich sensory protein
MKTKQVVGFITAILIVELIGNIGTIFTLPAITTWYTTLSKPAFNPPNWVFGPVWTILYALMGIAAYLVWERRTRNKQADAALEVFGAQLALNILWSLSFFGLHSPLYGLVVIVLLLAAIALTMIRFYKISKTAAYLLVPYLLWVAFASVLNFYVWKMNSF